MKVHISVASGSMTASVGPSWGRTEVWGNSHLSPSPKVEDVNFSGDPTRNVGSHDVTGG